jgi:hypothetical protein
MDNKCEGHNLKNPSKNACQAPKHHNSNKTNQIAVEKQFHSICYNKNSIGNKQRPSVFAGPNSFRKNTLILKVSGMNTLPLSHIGKVLNRETLR